MASNRTDAGGVPLHSHHYRLNDTVFETGFAFYTASETSSADPTRATVPQIPDGAVRSAASGAIVAAASSVSAVERELEIADCGTIEELWSWLADNHGDQPALWV